jgi:Ca2+-binding EF-hand superfamily protein
MTGKNTMKLTKHVSTLTAITALSCLMSLTPAFADDDKKAGGERFKKSDTNADGMLSKSEMKVQQEKRLDKMFSKADANNDGLLSKEELRTHRKNKKAHKAEKS